jgi:hypothetical protein
MDSTRWEDGNYFGEKTDFALRPEGTDAQEPLPLRIACSCDVVAC